MALTREQHSKVEQAARMASKGRSIRLYPTRSMSGKSWTYRAKEVRWVELENGDRFGETLCSWCLFWVPVPTNREKEREARARFQQKIAEAQEIFRSHLEHNAKLRDEFWGW